MTEEREAAMFEDEMTEAYMVRTEAEYRAVTRQEIREQRAADDQALRRAQIDATFAAATDALRRLS